ncbi:MAG TPA: hypothetical protein VMU26_24175 [Candidatus Polarisedimenticolia bacterium]|nr:hypothetical protein [Candidatus Polarisedimenticolia bacterium]
MTVTNGNGQGKDEVRSFEVTLNGKNVVSSDHSPSAQATVAVQMSNNIKVILTGEPSSKVLVLIAYDPRQSK